MAAAVALIVICLLGLSAGNRPPEVRCPSSLTIFVEEGRTSAVMDWKEPTAIDPEEGPLTPTLTKFSVRRGTTQDIGEYSITYAVKDKENRRDRCSFVVTVAGAQCLPIIDVNHGRSSCNQGALYGDECYSICDNGYEVMGDNSITCQIKGSYSGVTPQCEELSYYTKICRNIRTSSADALLREINSNLDKILEQLQTSGQLSIFKSIERAGKLCSDTSKERHGVCVFLRRYKLFSDLTEDITGATNQLLTYRQTMLLHVEINSFCDEPVFYNEVMKFLPDIGRFSDAGYRNSFRATVESLSTTKAKVLRKRAGSVCGPKDKGDKCLLRDLFRLMDRSELFLLQVDKAGTWNNEDINNYFNALTFGSVILKWKYVQKTAVVQPKDSNVQQGVITRLVRDIAMYIDDGADDKIRNIMTMFPEFQTDKICNSGTMCLFWRVVDQTRVYARSRMPKTSKGVQVRILDTQINLREFLQQKQMERILQLLADQEYNLVAVANDLKGEFSKVINQRFSELKTYFRKVHKFNADKSKADLGVFNDVKEMQKSMTSLAKEVDTNLALILSAAMISVGLEITEKSINLAFVIAENCNPLKVLTDSSVSDIMDATAELANAVASLAKASRLVAAIFTIRDRAVYIKEGFSKNNKFILAMRRIMEAASADKKTDEFEEAKDLFLESYGDFDPAIKKPRITELAAYFSNVVEEACGLIDGTSTTLAAASKAIVGGSGLCWLTKVKIEKMVATLESIYDMQFEMIEVMVSNVQSQVALEAANGILTDYDAVAQNNAVTEDVLTKLQQVAGLSYVSYRIMTVQAVRMYCDELQYLAGGIRPSVCKDTGTDISTLLSFNQPVCSTRALEFQTVPEHKMYAKDRAYLNFKKLYAGEQVSFKIPNSRWLYRAGWITKADVHSVIYVSGFEVYLPSEATHRRDIRVQVSVEGENELVPGGIRYKIRSLNPMIFEYKVGYGVNCRQSRGYRNPYSTCHSNVIPEVCPKTEYSCFIDGGTRFLYPSIFSHFKVRVNGYEGMPVPNPATPLPIKVAIRTCTYIIDSNKQSFIDNIRYQGKKRLPSTCCLENQYWSGRYMRCMDCSKNSTVALRGYYCEKPVTSSINNA